MPYLPSTEFQRIYSDLLAAMLLFVFQSYHVFASRVLFNCINYTISDVLNSYWVNLQPIKSRPIARQVILFVFDVAGADLKREDDETR